MVRRKVKRVLDGDTFVVGRKVSGSNKIRLAGYNAPESYQFGGSRTTNRLRGLIGGKTVTITPKAKSYGRVVADVRLNRRSVSKRMEGR